MPHTSHALDDLAPALHTFGYTPAQARFLTLVILHSGVFLRRQYRAFCEGGRGSLDARFIDKLLRARHATALPYHGRERVYHVNAKALYAALGRDDGSNRRRLNPARRAQRLLALDYLLTAPDHQYASHEADKVALFTELGIPRDLWPVRTFPERHDPVAKTTHYFPDDFPIYHDPTDGVVFLVPYPIPGAATVALDTFLARYLPLVRALPRVTLRYLHPASVRPISAIRTLARFQRDPDGRLAKLRAALRRYFWMRERIETKHTRGLTIEDLDDHRADQVRFHRDHYHRRYRMWRQLNPAHRENALADLDDLPAAKQIAPLSNFRFCTHALPHRYAFEGVLVPAPDRELRCSMSLETMFPCTFPSTFPTPAPVAGPVDPR